MTTIVNRFDNKFSDWFGIKYPTDTTEDSCVALMWRGWVVATIDVPFEFTTPYDVENDDVDDWDSLVEPLKQLEAALTLKLTSRSELSYRDLVAVASEITAKDQRLADVDVETWLANRVADEFIGTYPNDVFTVESVAVLVLNEGLVFMDSRAIPALAVPDVAKFLNEIEAGEK